jgi:hypothetical protein
MRILVGWLKRGASEGCGGRGACAVLLVSGAQDVEMRSAIINPATLEIVRVCEQVKRRNTERFPPFLAC